MGRRRRLRAARRAARRHVRGVRARAVDPRDPHTPRAGDQLHGRRLLARHGSRRCVRRRAGAGRAERGGRAGDRVRLWEPRALHRRAGLDCGPRSRSRRAARDPGPAGDAARCHRTLRVRDESRGHPRSRRRGVRRARGQRASAAARARGGLGHHAPSCAGDLGPQARRARPEAARPRADRRSGRRAHPARSAP